MSPPPATISASTLSSTSLDRHRARDQQHRHSARGRDRVGVPARQRERAALALGPVGRDPDPRPALAHGSDPLEVARALPGRDGVLELALLDAREEQVVLEHVVAERLAHPRRTTPPPRSRRRACAGSAARPSRRRGSPTASAAARACARCRRGPAAISAANATYGIRVGAGNAALAAQRRVVADDPEAGGAVVGRPGDRGRRERALHEALVAVHGGREEERDLARVRRAGRRATSGRSATRAAGCRAAARRPRTDWCRPRRPTGSCARACCCRPSPASHLAMNVIASPSEAAISFAAFL